MALLLVVQATASKAQTSWNSTSSGTWSTAANWTAGSPATGPQLADYPGTATLQHTLDLAGGTGRVSIGHVFDFVAGGVGYTFNGTAGTVSGLFIRTGGTANAILNKDDSSQTFNVPVKLTSGTGIAGAGAAMVFNAAAGDMVFNGNNNAPSAPWTINLNGASSLTFTGNRSITVGSSGPGQILNTNVGTFSGLVKNGSGILTLGGTAANTFVGTNFLNAGIILAGKVDALGNGNALVLNGGDLMSGGLNQTLGTLDVQSLSILDFGTGSSAISFANSSAFTWGGSSLVLSNWTSGSDTLRFGLDASGLTSDELNKISWADLPGAVAQIDANGFVIPASVPEPSVAAFALLGGLGLFIRRRKVWR